MHDAMTLSDVEMTLVLERLNVADIIPPRDRELAIRRAALGQWAKEHERHAEDLAAAITIVRSGRSSPAEAARLWLHRQRVDADRMPVLIHRTGEGLAPIRLGELFVDVELVRDSRSHAGFGGGRQNLGGGAQSLPAALQVIEKARDKLGTRGVVLIGLPGSGKSTLLKNQLMEDAKDPQRAPTLLLRFATLQKLLDRPLKAGFLRSWASREAELAGYPDAAAVLLNDPGRPYRFLLDGFDELQQKEHRRAVVSWLAREELPYWTGADFVLTTRRAAWEEEDRSALQHLLLGWSLLRLTPQAIVEYIRKWFPLVAEAETFTAPEATQKRVEEDYIARGEQLIQEVIQTPGPDASRVERLTGNPLLLSVVCLIFREERRMPRNRGELYRKCFEVLIAGRRADGRCTGFAEAVGEGLLGALAWQMQESSEELDSPRELPKADVLAELDRARDFDSSVRDTAPEALLRTLVEECCLLVTADHQSYAFAHLTFQEYLAFRHAAVGRMAAQLAARAADARWREVILLGMSDQTFQEDFWASLLRRPGALAALPPDLLAACLLEKASAADLVAVPWVDLFQRADPRPPVEDLRVALGIFRAAAPRAVIRAADMLGEHPDPGVVRLAAELGGREVVSQVRSLALPGGPPLALVPVPAGEFWMGASTAAGSRNFDAEARNNESPVHRVRVSAFWLGQHPVTNAQYRAFVAATGHRAPDAWRQEGFEGDLQPVTGVDWTDATALCVCLSKVTGAQVRLPTEAQWEWAARGEDARRYPWGNEAPTPERAVFRGAKLAAVGGRPAGASPCGAQDMAGNVWEWTATAWAAYVSGDDNSVSGEKNDTETLSSASRVVRGGSWGVGPGWLRAACRNDWQPGSRFGSFGFRVCVLREPVR